MTVDFGVGIGRTVKRRTYIHLGFYGESDRNDDQLSMVGVRGSRTETSTCPLGGTRLVSRKDPKKCTFDSSLVLEGRPGLRLYTQTLTTVSTSEPFLLVHSLTPGIRLFSYSFFLFLHDWCRTKVSRSSDRRENDKDVKPVNSVM